MFAVAPVYTVPVAPPFTVPFVTVPAFTVTATPVGAVESICTVLLVSATLFPDTSWHEFAPTVTVCSFADCAVALVPVFVTTNVYVVSFTFVNVPFVPFVTVTSSVVKSDVGLLNVNVYVIEFAFVGFALGAAVIATVNAVLSIVTFVFISVAALAFVALSFTFPAATSNVNAPFPDTPAKVNV